MILSQKQTTIAYRCPHCGATVFSMVGVFALTADMLRLKCPCGESELSIVYTKDKKIRLNVPCFLCPSPHSLTVSSQLFFESEILAFPCAYSGVDICFVGKKEKIDEALAAADAELERQLGGASLADLAKSRAGESGVFSDPQIMDIVMYVIHELQAEGEITCRCPEHTGTYQVEILEDCVRVACTKCGAKTDIPTDSIVSANAFLHCTHIELT